MVSQRARSAIHTAVAPRSTDELVALLVPYMRAALETGAPVHVSLHAERLEALRDALGPASAGVRWTDSATWHPSPPGRLRAFEELVTAGRHAGGLPGRFVCECASCADDPPELLAEWLRVDAVLNDVLAGTGIDVVCVYHAPTLPAPVIGEALRSHPHVGLHPPVPRAGAPAPRAFLARLQPTALPVPEDARRIAGLLDPGDVREFLRGELARRHTPPAAVEELLLVATELVTNSRQAGASWIALACWWNAHGIVVQVDDDGSGTIDLGAGYLRPPLDALGGRGLWIARQLTDVVEIAPRAEGTAVRAHALGRRHASAE